jgi:hypothetical protein
MSEKILSDVKKSSTVTTLNNAHTAIEGFTEVFERLSNVCALNSLRPDIAALSLRGRILLLRLPDFLGPAVQEIFAAKPEVVNVELLDLSTSETIACWCLQFGDGTKYIVQLPVGMLMHAAVDYKEGASMFSCLDVAVCAGDYVASGKIVLDEEDIFDAQAASMCSTSYIEHSDEERAEAWAVTAAAGGPRPWYNSIWENDEGQLELGLASFCD